MAIKQDNRTFINLIQLTGAGMYIADYPAIKRALVTKYKEIYGEDIDLTNTTADGVFVETLTLMINNILQDVKYLYSNLDIRTASGKYLESLCALTGVYRNLATKSIAQLEVTNTGDSNIILSSVNPLVCIDQSGLTWRTQLEPGITIELIQNETQIVDVYCDTVGPITAPQGWINQTIETSGNLTINQIEKAIKGSFAESDSELRSRRNEVISSQGTTVVSNLKGSLLDITGIEDVIVYNNASSTGMTSLDGTVIPQRAIYIILRKNKNVTITDSYIGNRIYNKMTPGIATTNFTGQANTGVSKESSFSPTDEDVSGSGSLSVPVYWKEATPINAGLTISITYQPGTYFASADNTTLNLIAKTTVDYLNSLSMNSEIDSYELCQIVNAEDPLFNNTRTYSVLDVELNQTDAMFVSNNIFSSLVKYTAKDTYFDINEYIFTESDGENGIKILTISVTS